MFRPTSAMRRGKKGKRDEAQSSLDAFTSAPSEPKSTPPKPVIPSMPDLDALARADEKIRNAELEKDSELEEKDEVNPLQTFSMPSMEQSKPQITSSTDVLYHDLGELYPNPPILTTENGMVLHLSLIHI